MVKYIIVGFVVCIICGSVWFSFGRHDTSDLDRIVKDANIEFKRISGSVSSFGVDLTEYTGDFSNSVTEAVGINTQLGELRENFWERSGYFISEIGLIHESTAGLSNMVDKVELGLSESLRINSDISEIAYFYRRRVEEDEVEE